MKPGGVAVIEVPAGPHLFDIYDRYLMHFRRYDLKELKAQAARLGLEILSASHFGFLAYPAFYWAKRKNQRLAALDDEKMRQSVSTQIRQSGSSRLLAISLKLESLLRKIAYLPLGIRCVMTCRKPGS